MRFGILLHRWLGMLLCLFFSMWFVSGAVLMYHPFPFLSEPERYARGTNLNFPVLQCLR